MDENEQRESQVVNFETTLENFKLEKVHVDRLPGFVSDTPQILEYIQKAMNYTSDVAFDLEENDQSDALNSLETGLKECIHLEYAINTQKKLFHKLRSDLLSGEQLGEGLPKYNEYWDAEMTAYNNLSDKKKYYDHGKYNEFKQLIWSVKHPDEPMTIDDDGDDNNDDIVVAATKKSLKCPITTSWLEEPVTSNTCNHTFSKAAILSLIERSKWPTVECPIPGCRELLSRDSFYDDTLMERMVAKEKEKEKEENSNRSMFHDVE